MGAGLARVSLSLVLLAPAALPSWSQVSLERDPFRDLPPAAAPADRPVLPGLRLELVRSIDLPGPLPGRSPRWLDGHVTIPVAGGFAVADPLDESGGTRMVDTAPAGTDVEEDDWSLAPDGRFRARLRDDGRLLVHVRCRRCVGGWRRAWRLRVPGGADLARPLVTARHVFIGAMDNRIYALKRRNGHRRWTTDVGARVTRPLAVVGDERPVVIAIQDDGTRLIALDASDGRALTDIELGEGEGEFVGEPLPLPDGSIAVARQRYRRSEAAVEIYRLEERQAPPVGEKSPENGPAAGLGDPLRYTAVGSSAGASGP